MKPYIQPNRPFFWRIEYEIPPTRAVHVVTSEQKLVESDMREWIAAKEPAWKILNLRPIIGL